MMRQCLIILCTCISITTSAQSKNGHQLANGIHSTVLFESGYDSISCYRIPSIVTAPNGDLLVAIDERVPSCGDLKWSRDINIVMRRSTDDGSTWTDVERLVDFADGRSASDPSMIVDHMTGVIFLFYNYMDLDNEKDIYYLHVISSKDDGKTWSEPTDITSQISKSEWHHDFKFITSGRGIQTSDGKLLHCLVNLDHGMHVFGSDDHGTSWQLYDTPITPGNESKIVELTNGDWMINSRSNGSGIRFVHTSKDNGKTWSSRPDSTLIDPGCNASIIRYSQQEKYPGTSCLIFSNANSNDSRTNLSVRISYDDGQTWSRGKSIYKGSSAYSTMTVLANGDIGLVFEKDDYLQNVFVRLTWDWWTSGSK